MGTEASEVKVPAHNAELIRAYVAAKHEVTDAFKNANNPHLGNNYADLSSVLDVVRPVERKHGLALMQIPGAIEVREDGTAVMTMHGILFHGPSGQQMGFATQIPLPPDVDKKTGLRRPISPQHFGGGLSYCRRYQLTAVWGITQTDDDGNASSGRDAEAETTSTDTTELLKQIALAVEHKSMDELKPLREQVQALNNNTVTNAYMSARSIIKGE